MKKKPTFKTYWDFEEWFSKKYPHAFQHMKATKPMNLPWLYEGVKKTKIKL